MTTEAILPGDTFPDADAARANREAIEAALKNGNAEGDFPGYMVLPSDRLELDRAPMLTPKHSGATLQGAGPGRTSLRNGYTPTPFGQNSTLAAFGEGVGYCEQIGGRLKATATLTVPNPQDYPPGRVAYTWVWDGYVPELGGSTRCVRRRVVAVNGNAVTLDSAVPPEHNAMKWVEGWPVGFPLEERAVAFSTDAALAAGAPVFVTGGPAVANEAAGEFRTVQTLDRIGVSLNRPLRRSYAQPTLCPIRAVRGLTVSDLTLDQPVLPAAECGTFKFCHRLTLRNVRAPGVLSLTTSAEVLLEDCEIGDLRLNTCHDVRIRGGHFGSVLFEEACFDCAIENCTVGPSPVNGVSCGTDCERLTLRNVVVYGAGDMPIGMVGRELVLDGVESHGGQICYVSGDNVRVSNWRGAGPLVLSGGAGQLLLGAHAPEVYLGWFDGTGAPLPDTGGRAYGIVGAVRGNLLPERRPDPLKWAVG